VPSGKTDSSRIVRRDMQAGDVMGGSSRQERVARYRRQAAAVRAKADQVQDPTVHRQLLDVASQYEALATSIEQLPLRGE